MNDGMHPNMLLEPEAAACLEHYGISYPPHRLVGNPNSAAQAAGELGFPVVMKIVSPEIVHKSDLGGVETGLATAAEVRAGYRRIMSSICEKMPGAKVEGVLVCQQAPPGVEVIIGGLVDPMFGPALMFGMGGVIAEVLKDVAFRILPISKVDAREMLAEVRGYPLLAGFRNHPACDLDALVELLLRVSRLMTAQPEIEELDLNPVRVYPKGALVLDVKMMLKGGS